MFIAIIVKGLWQSLKSFLKIKILLKIFLNEQNLKVALIFRWIAVIDVLLFNYRSSQIRIIIDLPLIIYEGYYIISPYM